VSEAVDRLYPPRPILSVSIAVFRAGRVLIAKRGRAPFAGAFSLPGGVVEIGETLEEAALRELLEETGVDADVLGFNDFLQPIERVGEGVRSHYVIASFVGLWRAGEALTSAEATDCRWVAPDDTDSLETTPGLPALVRRAATIAGSRA
jgi:8-oxo-dGTP diphosphatase